MVFLKWSSLSQMAKLRTNTTPCTKLRHWSDKASKSLASLLELNWMSINLSIIFMPSLPTNPSCSPRVSTAWTLLLTRSRNLPVIWVRLHLGLGLHASGKVELNTAGICGYKLIEKIVYLTVTERMYIIRLLRKKMVSTVCINYVSFLNSERSLWS